MENEVGRCDEGAENITAKFENWQRNVQNVQRAVQNDLSILFLARAESTLILISAKIKFSTTRA